MKQAIRLLLLTLSCIVPLIICGRVRVKIYDHRAQHDPKEQYGNGPWHYLGYGYGIGYEYEPDFSYQREKGYGYLQAYGRDMCNSPHGCRQDPNFFRKMFDFNGGEPFYGAPPAHYEKSVGNSVDEPSPYPEWM